MRNAALAILFFLTLLSLSCSRGAAVAESNSAPREIPSVAVATVKTENLSRNLTLTAEFRPYQEVDVMAKVAGYIKQINVDIGDRVQQGQLLATLEIPEMGDDLRRANAAMDRSHAEVQRAEDEKKLAQSASDIAQLSFNRLNAVAEKRPGLIAQQEIDDARGRFMLAEARVASASSGLAAAKEQVGVNGADVAHVKTMMDYTRVNAPFTGVVTKRYADTGSMIQAGTASQTQAMPVVRISQNNLLRLILPTPESAVPTVHIGQSVEVRVPAMHRTFPGRVARFADKLSLETRTMDTEVDVVNPALTLMPGMYAEVDLALDQRKGALTIPVTAVDAAQQVMVVTPGNRIEIRKIQVGLETANAIEVKSGLNEGDRVVIGNRGGLQAGQEVRPQAVKMDAQL